MRTSMMNPARATAARDAAAAAAKIQAARRADGRCFGDIGPPFLVTDARGAFPGARASTTCPDQPHCQDTDDGQRSRLRPRRVIQEQTPAVLRDEEAAAAVRVLKSAGV